MTSIGVGVGVGFQEGMGEGGVPPNPGTLSTLLAWYDSSDTATIIVHPGQVSSMLDLSVNDFDLTQPNASNRPTSGASTMNGLNILDFTAPNNRLLSDNISIPVFDGNDICLSVVVRPDDVSLDSVFVLHNLGTLRNDGWRFLGGIGNNNQDHAITAGDQILTIHITDTETNYYKDGVLISTVGFASESLNDIDQLEMGSNNLNGSIASVVIWRDPANIPLVINYQKETWGIT